MTGINAKDLVLQLPSELQDIIWHIYYKRIYKKVLLELREYLIKQSREYAKKHMRFSALWRPHGAYYYHPIKDLMFNIV